MGASLPRLRKLSDGEAPLLTYLQPRLWGFTMLCGYGLLLAAVIAQEQWLYAGVLASLPLVVLRPVEMALGVFAFLVPFETIASRNRTAGPGSTLNWYVGAAAGLLLIGTGLLEARFERPPKAALWWGGLMVWGLSTTLWAVNPDVVLQRLPTAFALFFLYAAAVCLRVSKTELFWVILLTILGGLTAATYAAWQFYHGVGYISADTARKLSSRATLVLSRGETDPNMFAASLLLPLSLAVGGSLALRRGILRIVCWLASAILTFGLLTTMSRGSLLAVAAMTFVFLRRHRVDWRILTGIAVLPLMTLALPQVFFARLASGLASHGEGRFDIWRVGLRLLGDWGILGAGLDNFPVVYSKYAGYAPVFQGFGRAPHNIYLGIAVELGLVGLLLLIGAVSSEMRAARPFIGSRGTTYSPLETACEAACWGMLVMGLSIDILWLKAFWLVWILMALAVHIRQADFEAGDGSAR
jgi:putative inorganic carbon (HCO3(-)) transporter